MKIMVIGGGGREHAVIKKLKESPKCGKIYALPGNGGISELAECVDIKATDVSAIVDFAVENKIDFAVVTPDDPLVLGAVDRLHEKGIKCFGPEASAAIIEGSKVFSKNLMKKYGIPTASYEVFDDPSQALDYLGHCTFPAVIKADGLALGKGVIIADSTLVAVNAIKKIMKDRVFGDSGSRIVIEEFLTGPEVSVLCFTDGKTIKPMVSSMDHKRAHDGDLGLNTGGMGTVAPNPYYTKDIAEICMKTIFRPTVEAMNKEGRRFKGCLYFGLMLTEDGPKVIEYNCRFGDPETQVVLPLLQSDLLEIMLAVEEERLGDADVKFSSGAAACVVMASGGYPEKYETGFGVKIGKLPENTFVFHAGTKKTAAGIVTSGGRVLGVSAVGKNLSDALDTAYRAVSEITFESEFHRNDIGQKALSALGEE